MNSIEKRPSAQPPPSPINPERGQPGFLSLRAKFSIFISLLIMLVCSGLSAVLLQQESAVMEQALMNTGTMLVKTINKLSTNRLIIQDIDYLETMLDGALSAPEVVYAIARDQEGRILVGKSKGVLQKASQVIRDQEHPLFPNDTVTNTFFSQQHPTPYTQPLISVWDTVPHKIGKISPRPSGKPAAEMSSTRASRSRTRRAATRTAARTRIVTTPAGRGATTSSARVSTATGTAASRPAARASPR